MSGLAQDGVRQGADVVLLNGKVTTGKADGQTEEALAMQGERILAVGTSKDIRALADGRTTVVDVEGRRVIPGLVDSHVHLVRAGLTWNDELHWDGVTDLDEALTMIAYATEVQEPGSWIRVVGAWHPGQFGAKRGPTREELDAIAPRHPVYVQLLYEDALVNDVALQMCGVTAETSDPPGGTFERDGAGEPTGRVRGVPAFNFFLQRMGQPAFEQQLASTRSLMREFNRVGLTMVIDAGGLGAVAEIYRPIFALWRQGAMPLRTRLYLGATERGREQEQIEAWIRQYATDAGDDYLRVVGAGEIIVLGYHDLEGLSPFEVAPSSRSALYEITRVVAQQGWPMHIHAVWDTTITAILDVWEEVNRELPLAGRRFSLAHADMITEADLSRVQAMGIGIAVQDRLVFRSADSARAWGQAKAHGAPPLRHMLDRGIPIGAGTDATRVTSFNPWVSLWWLVTGCSLDGAAARDSQHCLSRAEALRLYTSGSAWFSFDEHNIGTLEPGKLADVAVLSDDYFTVPDEAIPALTSALTYVGGRPIYTSKSFTGIKGLQDI